MGQPLSVLVTSLQFYGRYLLPLLGLALFAACGRVIQLGWSGQRSATTYWGLEMMVEVFSLFAYLVNSGISWLAEQNALLAFVQRIPYLGSLERTRLPMLIVFFLKNLTSIPFTLVWVFYGLVHLLQ